MQRPARGAARIVVVRVDKGFIGFGDRSFRVKIDDETMGDLMTNSFVSLDVSAGRHHIVADLWEIPGVTRADVHAAAGRTYYFAATLNRGVNVVYLASAFAGIAGAAMVMGASRFGADRGAIDLMPMNEAQARRAIVDVQAASAVAEPAALPSAAGSDAMVPPAAIPAADLAPQ